MTKKKVFLIDPFDTITVSDLINQGKLPLRPFDEDDWKRVRKFEDMLSKGMDIPVIVIRRKKLNGEYYVIDGDHRVLAARKLNKKIRAKFR